MKRFVWIVAAALAGCATPPTTTHNTGLPQYTVQTSSGEKITHYESAGNLQSNATLGCVRLSAVTGKHTPADIYPGVAACIKAGDFEKAAPLYLVAGVFGRFDKLRVSDRTAHQAVTVLQRNDFADLTQDQRESFFMNYLQPRLEKGSSSLAALCAAVDRVGPPDYFPNYMIQHGMGAYLGRSDGGLVQGFDPDKGWQDSLSGYLHCS